MGSPERIRTLSADMDAVRENGTLHVGEKQTDSVAIDFGGMNPEAHAAIREVCEGGDCPPEAEVTEAYEVPVSNDVEEIAAVTHDELHEEIETTPETTNTEFPSIEHEAESEEPAPEVIEDVDMTAETKEEPAEPQVEVHESERGTSIYSDGEALDPGWNHYVAQKPETQDQQGIEDGVHDASLGIEITADEETQVEAESDPKIDITQLSYAELLDIPPTELMKHPNAREVIDAAHRKAQSELSSEMVKEETVVDEDAAYKAAEDRIVQMLGVSQMSHDNGVTVEEKEADANAPLSEEAELQEDAVPEPVVRKLTPESVEPKVSVPEEAVESAPDHEDAKLRTEYLDTIASLQASVEEIKKEDTSKVVGVLIDRFENDKNRLEAALGIGAHNIGTDTESVTYTDGQKKSFEQDRAALQKVFDDINKFHEQEKQTPQSAPEQKQIPAIDDVSEIEPVAPVEMNSSEKHSDIVPAAEAEKNTSSTLEDAELKEAADTLRKKEMKQLFKGGEESDEWLRGSGLFKARRALAPQQVNHFLMTRGHLTDDRVVKWLHALQERSGQLDFNPNETLAQYIPRLYEEIVKREGVEDTSDFSGFRKAA